jgi:Uncharacterized protein involved in methicillin resistance
MRVDLVRSADAVELDFREHVFASPEYLGAKSRNFGWFVGGPFVLPFYCDRNYLFVRMIFPDAVLCRASVDADAAEEQLFLDEVVAHVRRAKLCDFISKPQANAVFRTAPSDAIVADWGTYEVRIDRSDSEILQNLHVKHRNVVLKAQRDGVKIEPVIDPQIVQACLRDTLKRQGLPYFPSLALVEKLMATLRDKPISLGAYLDGELQGVAFVPFDRNRGYYLYGGSCERPHGGAMNLLHYEVMRSLRDRGVATYDLVGARLNVKKGSKYEGIQRFKSRFGTSLRQGLTFRVVINPLKYRLFNTLADVRFHLAGRRYVDPIDQLRNNDYA